jgi:hypothetical protein
MAAPPLDALLPAQLRLGLVYVTAAWPSNPHGSAVRDSRATVARSAAVLPFHGASFAARALGLARIGGRLSRRP